jgi:predicted nuclease with TOPRIM domain
VLIYSVYARQKVDIAYEDVISQNEKLIEKNDTLKDKYDKLKPKYDMLTEEYEKLNNSAEEAKNAQLSEFEDENTEETTAEEAAQ